MPRFSRACSTRYPQRIQFAPPSSSAKGSMRLASDVYPNQPNVRRYQVALDAAVFDDPRWDVSDIGPFVLAIRQ